MFDKANVREVADLMKGMVLVGHTEPNEEGWGKLIFLDRQSGLKYHIEPSCDPEGNRPGYLFFGRETTGGK